MIGSIDGEKWAAAGQPPLHEVHGFLLGVEDNVAYGRVLPDEEAAVCYRALVEWRSQEPLPLDF